MRWYSLIILLFLSANIQAQFSVRLLLTEVATRKNDPIYVSGTFNGWQPAAEAYRLKPFAGGRLGIVLKDLPAGHYAFKFSRGAQKMESTADGRDIPDRLLTVEADGSFDFQVAGWKDDYPDKPKSYTALPTVRLLDSAFALPDLGRSRRVWVCLPKNYAQTGKAYPVVYFQDGQNLFNEQTAFAGEWGMDECLDSLVQQSFPGCIVVGIANGEAKRQQEYNPYDHLQFGAGEGKAYLKSIVEKLKPYIDAKYRTRKGVAHTYIGGSSMGALIATYALLEYPQVFGGAALFSPAFWVAPELYKDASTKAPAGKKIFLYYGGQESANLLGEVKKMETIFNAWPEVQKRTVYQPLGQHREAAWRGELALMFQWLSVGW
ncbi:MAG: alpha/beta hydrolase [Sphingobacteriia bacterium]|nr:MAG: alpha/beta hydrolase [Sphingobacteriia bacterium]